MKPNHLHPTQEKQMAKAKKKPIKRFQYPERSTQIIKLLGSGGLSIKQVEDQLQRKHIGPMLNRMVKDGMLVKSREDGLFVFAVPANVAATPTKTNGVTKHYDTAKINNLRVKVSAEVAARFRAFVQKNGFSQEQEAKFFGAYVEQAMNNFEDPLYSARKKADEAMRQLGISVAEIGKAEA